MASVIRQDLTEDSLLKTYRGGAHPDRWGRYGDCFSIIVERAVSLRELVYAFYTSPVFRLERLLLGLAGARAVDADARALADGRRRAFAIWSVAERTADQLLMADRYERTRSWFRVEPLGEDRTRLLFGSAVAAGSSPLARRGPVFRLLLIFHVMYSRLLLRSAQRVLRRAAKGPFETKEF